MRHLVAHRKLNRTAKHRLAMRRNMAQNLFERGQIRTTLAKAKDVRPFVEKLITLARIASKGSLAARQRLIAALGDRAVIPAESQEEYEGMSDAARSKVLRSRSGRRHRLGGAKGGMPFTASSIVHHLITEVAPRFEDRPGGYTRVIRIGRSRRNDNAPEAVLQLVGEEESPGNVTRPERTARKRRAERRYATAAKLLKGGKKSGAPKDEAPVEEQSAPAPEAAADATPQADTGEEKKDA